MDTIFSQPHPLAQYNNIVFAVHTQCHANIWKDKQQTNMKTSMINKNNFIKIYN